MKGWGDDRSGSAQAQASSPGQRQDDSLRGTNGEPLWPEGPSADEAQAMVVPTAVTQAAGRESLGQERIKVSNQEAPYGVQVNLKYGQTLINIPAASPMELRQKLSELTAESISDDTATLDFVMQLTELLHKGEREAGIFQEQKSNFRGAQGGGGGAPRGGTARPPEVPQGEVTYWVGNEKTGAQGLPEPEGAVGPNCRECGATTVMQWSAASKKAGPNFGKRWPVWHCTSGQTGRGHGEFWRA